MSYKLLSKLLSNRQGTVYLTAAVGLLISVVLALDAYNDYQSRRKAVLKQASLAFSAAIDERMAVYTQVHFSGLAFLLSSNYVTRDEWENFVETCKIMDLHPGMFGLGYTKRIDSSEVSLFEHEYETPGGFKLYPKQKAHDHIPVVFIAPSKRNRRAFGFDMGSEANRRRALELSVKSGKPRLTKKVILVQDNTKSPGFLLYVPVFGQAESLEDFRGWVYSAFVASDFFETLLEEKVPTLASDFELAVIDSEGDVLFETSQFREHQEETCFEISLHGESWTVHLAPRTSFQLQLGGQAQFDLSVGALLVTILFVALQLLLIRTNVRAERLAKRLKRLHDKRYHQLLKKNEELDSFTYIASHDLKSPLRGIDNLASWLEEDAEDSLDSLSRIRLGEIRSTVADMETLMSRLLEYSRVVRADYQQEILDLDVFLKTFLRAKPAHVPAVETEGVFPKLKSCPRHLKLILSCLLDSLSLTSDEMIEIRCYPDTGPIKIGISRKRAGLECEPLPVEAFSLDMPKKSDFGQAEILGAILAQKTAVRVGACLRFAPGIADRCPGIMLTFPTWLRV